MLYPFQLIIRLFLPRTTDDGRRTIVYGPSSIVQRKGSFSTEKGIRGILLSTLLCLFAPYGAWAIEAEDRVTLSISDISAAPGDTAVAIPILLKNENGAVRAVQIVLTYDPGLIPRIRVRDLQKTDRTSRMDMVTAKVPSPGDLRVIIADFGRDLIAPGSGAIATLFVDVSDASPDTATALTFITEDGPGGYHTKVTGEDILFPLSVENGTIHILILTNIDVADTVAFGDVPLNSVREKDLVIRNTGNRDLTVFGVAVTDSDDGMFSTGTFTSTVVPPEDSTSVTLTITVKFAPSDTGLHVGTLTIWSDAPGKEGRKRVQLVGRGVLDVTGTTVTAYPTEIAAHPNSFSIITVVPRDGGKKIDPTFITVTVHTTAGTFEGGVTEVRATHQGDSTYTAILHAETDVAKIATITATVSGREITNVATVTFVPARAVVSPTAINFGGVRAGTSKKNTLRIRNNGWADLVITNVATKTTAFDATPEGMAVSSTQTGAIEVTFAPSDTGSFADMLSFMTNDPIQPSVSVPLSGRSRRPDIARSSDTLNFGPVTTIDSLDRVLQISNPGTWSLTVTGLTITAGADTFRVVSPAVPQRVKAGGTLDATIRFAPKEMRVHIGTLTITSDAYDHPDMTVTLIGEGVFAFTAIEVSPPLDTVLVDTTRYTPAAFTTATFRAEGILPDLSRQDVTATATWSSTDPTVASVTAGMASGLKPGKAGIVATLQAWSDTSTLKIIRLGDLFTLELTGMIPHLGQKFEARVVDVGDGTEVGRVSLDAITVADFSIQIPGVRVGRSYRVDYYFDFNDNGVYDPPPVDHAWRSTFENTTGDVTVSFTHNTNFTDINWREAEEEPTARPGYVAGADNLPPAPVTNLVAQDTPNDRGGSITLTWTASADDKIVGGYTYAGYTFTIPGVVKYNIYRRTEDTEHTLLASVESGGTSYVDETAVTGVTYTYIVRAADRENEAPGPSASAVAKNNMMPVDETGEEIQGLFGEDNRVGMDDFLLFVEMFGKSSEDAGFEEKYDLDGDGSVGINDFLVFVANFGKVAVNY